MTASLSGVFSLQEFSDAGALLVGGRVYTYAAGTTTQKTAYTDAAGAVPHTYTSDGSGGQYIALNARGELPAPLFLTAGAYDIALKRADGSTVWTRQAVPNSDASATVLAALAASGGAALIGAQARTNAIATTVQEVLARQVRVFEYLSSAQKADVIAHTDLLDVSAAIQQAITDLGALGGGALIFDNGFYRVEQQITITSDAIGLVGTMVRGAVIRVHHDLGPAFIVQHASAPGTSYLNSFCMLNISVRALVPTTQGCCVQLSKVNQVYFDNVQLEDHFGGLQLLGGLQHFYNNFQIISPRSTGPAAWSGVKVGSYFMQVDRSTGDSSVPSEIFLNNINFRRNDAVNYVQNGIVLYSVDGFFVGGSSHIMGVDQSDVVINPRTGAEQLTQISFTGTMFDGNCTTNVTVTGGTTSSYGEVLLTGCRYFNPINGAATVGHCIYVDSSAATFEGVRVNGGRMARSGTSAIVLLGGLNHVFSGGLDIAAANTLGAVNEGGFLIGVGTGSPTGPLSVTIGDVLMQKTAQTTTAASMKGIVVSGATTTVVTCRGRFDLTDTDVVDNTANYANDYRGSTTTKSNALTAANITAGVLALPEVGDNFTLAAGANLSDISKKREGREVAFIALGALTVTSTVNKLRLTGAANFVMAAGDSLTLKGSQALTCMREKSRSVA